jgi:hypothetical protein
MGFNMGMIEDVGLEGLVMGGILSSVELEGEMLVRRRLRL